MLHSAAAADYVIGAFNMDSLDVLAALAQRVAETRSPVIFQFGSWSFRRLPPEDVAACGRAIVRRASQCYLHIDHCSDPDLCVRCAEAGFDSVMFDGTELPLEENIARCRQVAQSVRGIGGAVEGALGRLERGVDTDPAEARRFVRQTGVDALAVAVGTGHGQERRPEQIDLDRLEALSELEVPLVIHGGSGLPDAVIPAVRRTAAAKLNVATACYRAAEDSVEQWTKQQGPSGHVSRLAEAAAEGFWGVMRHRTELLGSLGRAGS
jgi:ketose-bisphosphate aldolase